MSSQLGSSITSSDSGLEAYFDVVPGFALALADLFGA
jgi:hypothetical protein